MNIAICFLTTQLNHFNISNILKQINSSKKHNIDLYVYLNDDNINVNYFPFNQEFTYVNFENNIIYFKYQYLFNKFNYKSINLNCIHKGCQFLIFLDMYVNNKYKYDWYIFYEDDLGYFGKKNLFDTLDLNGDCFLMKHPNSYTDWFWITNYNYSLDESIKTIYYNYVQTYGMSNKTLEQFTKFVMSGKNILHDEGLIYSFLINHNYNIKYLSDIFNLYINYQDINIDDIDQQYDFVHPIKTYEKYIEINNIIKNK